MTKEMTELQLMGELEPKMGELLNRHERASKFWVPDFYVPWSRGRDHRYPWARSDEDKEEYNAMAVDWEEGQETFKFSKGVRSALFIAAMTEDNLPSYHREIANLFGYDGAWRNWVNRWTAEEDRHGRAIHNLLAVSRTFNPIEIEESRMAQVQHGFVNDLPNPHNDGQLQSLSPIEGGVYVAMQELATVKAHGNTGDHTLLEGDRIAQELFSRVEKDEVLHWVVYRDLIKESFKMAPNHTMKATARVIEGFQMPGAESIPNFIKHAVRIAIAGIYDLKIQNEEVFVPNLEKHWDVWNVPNLDAEGEQARERIALALSKHRKGAEDFDSLVVQPAREKLAEKGL